MLQGKERCIAGVGSASRHHAQASRRRMPAGLPLLIALALVIALSGCAGAPAESTSVGASGPRIGDVSDFRVLDERNLVLYAPSRRHPWHLELAQRCLGLRFADTIRLTGRTGRLGGYAGDAILIDGPGGRPDRCLVSRATALDEAGLEVLLERFSGAAEEAEVSRTQE